MAAKQVNEAAINPIMSYFADKQQTEKVLRDLENTVIKSKCFYCKRCKNCQKFVTYGKEFVKKGFRPFNKEIKYWYVYDPDWRFRNRVLKLRPIRTTNFRM